MGERRRAALLKRPAVQVHMTSFERPDGPAGTHRPHGLPRHRRPPCLDQLTGRPVAKEAVQLRPGHRETQVHRPEPVATMVGLQRARR